MELRQLACGIWMLIENGIHRYTLEHGRKPFALVLHPAHFDEFYEGIETDNELLDNVVILCIPHFEASVLVNELGDTSEL